MHLCKAVNDNKISFYLYVFVSLCLQIGIRAWRVGPRRKKNYLLICITAVAVNEFSNVLFLADHQLLKLEISGCQDWEKKRCQLMFEEGMSWFHGVNSNEQKIVKRRKLVLYCYHWLRVVWWIFFVKKSFKIVRCSCNCEY